MSNRPSSSLSSSSNSSSSSEGPDELDRTLYGNRNIPTSKILLDTPNFISVYDNYNNPFQFDSDNEESSQKPNNNIITLNKKKEDRSLLANTVLSKEDILNFVKKSVDENKEEEPGSTLTFGSLDDNGNLKFAILGDSPVYLAVKDEHNKDIVIQISSDMDHNSDRYRHLCLKIEPDNNKFLNKGSNEYIEMYQVCHDRLGGALEVFGAIGDSEIKGIIIKPELYDFSKGTIFYDKLNDFLKTIGIKTPITGLLKSGGANVVMASDGLSDRKINNQSVCDYKMCLNGSISKKEYDYATDCLPAPTDIKFTKIEKGKVLNSKENPIVLIANNDIKEATEQTKNLDSKDDVTIFALQKGKTGLVLDGHCGQKVSNSAVQEADNFINIINTRPSRLDSMTQKMQNEPRNRALKDAVELYQNKHIKQNSNLIASIIFDDNNHMIEWSSKNQNSGLQGSSMDVKKYLNYIIYGTEIEQTHTNRVLSSRKTHQIL